MAMRPIRTSGGGVPPSRRKPVGPVYEDFKPLSEWRRQDEADILLVHVPGFMKEMIKVTTENRNIVRVRGERVLTGNKWSRFQEDYQVPEYCDMRGIRAKFEGGILAITMPRKTIATVISPRLDSTPRTRTQETRKNPDNSTNKLVPSPGPFLEKQDQTQKEANIHDADAGKRKERSSDNEQKGLPYKKVDAEKGNAKSSTNDQNGPLTKAGAENEKLSNNDQRGPSDKASDIIPRVFVSTSPSSSSSSSSIVDAEKHVPDREVPEGDYRGKERVEGKNAKEIKNVMLSSPSYKAGEYKKMVAKGMGKNEERELLVNMGVAVLVIVVLGAYVSYTTLSSLSKE